MTSSVSWRMTLLQELGSRTVGSARSQAHPVWRHLQQLMRTFVEISCWKMQCQIQNLRVRKCCLPDTFLLSPNQVQHSVFLVNISAEQFKNIHSTYCNLLLLSVFALILICCNSCWKRQLFFFSLPTLPFPWLMIAEDLWAHLMSVLSWLNSS